MQLLSILDWHSFKNDLQHKKKKKKKKKKEIKALNQGPVEVYKNISTSSKMQVSVQFWFTFTFFFVLSWLLCEWAVR